MALTTAEAGHLRARRARRADGERAERGILTEPIVKSVLVVESHHDARTRVMIIDTAGVIIFALGTLSWAHIMGVYCLQGLLRHRTANSQGRQWIG